MRLLMRRKLSERGQMRNMERKTGKSIASTHNFEDGECCEMLTMSVEMPLGKSLRMEKCSAGRQDGNQHGGDKPFYLILIKGPVFRDETVCP